MSELDARDIVLQTIDQLRRRKARPDINRICHMLKRKHGFNRTETERYIDKLVDAEIVIKVDYKGNTSYRNAKKWRKSHLGGLVLNSSSTGKMLVDAVTALTLGERETENGEKRGANIKDIEKWLISQPDCDRDALKCPLHVMLQREVDAGKLEKLSNGNYVVSPHGSKAGKMKALLKRCASTPTRRGRPPKKKKLRRFYSYMPESNTPSPVAVVPPALCDFCRNSTDSNKNGVPEELLICKDCDAKAHPSCMAYNHILAQRAQLYPWQCIDCKTCCVCEDSGEPDSMLFCDGCDKGYHMDCHQPKVIEKPSGKWICYECIIEGILLSEIERLDESNSSNDVPNGSDAIEESSGSNVFPTPRQSPVPEPEVKTKSKYPFFKQNGKSLKDLPAKDYPDASKWSIADVESFFESVGFKDQAYAFREQEIDGQSLLLMRRNDVLTGLSIRLGPALKIYEHVCKLQTAGHENSLFT